MSRKLRISAIVILVCMVCGIVIPFIISRDNSKSETKTIEYNGSSFIPYSERDGGGIAKYEDRFDTLSKYLANRCYIITVKAVDTDMNIVSTELSTVGKYKINTIARYEMKEIDGYTFDGWYDETGKVSDDLYYEHIVKCEKLLTARYIKDPEESTRYSTTRLNVREGAGTDYKIIATVPANYEFTVYDHNDNNMWDVVDYKGARYFVCAKYLSEEKVAVVAPTVVVNSTGTRSWQISDHFCYYGIWAGEYWHFTPEQLDEKRIHMPIGTTREWQRYLYEKLSERGLAWFYKIAVAQAYQESGGNPHNNINHTIITWLNGRATYDCGLFSFKDIYWTGAYGDVCDYRANINAYVDRVCACVARYGNDIEMMLSQHYNGTYKLSEVYCRDVYNRLPILWEMN